MKKQFIFALSMAFFCLAAVDLLQAKEQVCLHCEEIREYNAKHHENFEYYETYLESLNAKKDEEVADQNQKKVLPPPRRPIPPPRKDGPSPSSHQPKGAPNKSVQPPPGY